MHNLGVTIYQKKIAKQKIRLGLSIDFCLLWPTVQYSKTRVALI